MKFYNFDSEYPYEALIYAKDEKDAIAKYVEEVTDLEDPEEKALMPSELDINDVWAKMLTANYEENAKIKTYGISGDLVKIIETEETQVVLTDGALY